MRGRSKAAWLVLGLAALLPGTAWAHAILLDSTPAEGAAVPAGAALLRLHFNSRLDAARSRLSLAHDGGDAGVLTLDGPGAPDVLAARANLEAGAYVLRWQVLSVDGHITRGLVHFTATAGSVP
jgi:methionine-rich copper-binding protein CopC